MKSTFAKTKRGKVLKLVLPAKFRGEDLTGHRVGKLLVIGLAGFANNTRAPYWHLQCDCGKRIVATTKQLNYVTIRDCGCQPKKRWNDYE